MNGFPLSLLMLSQISHWQRLGDGLHRGKSDFEFADFLPAIAILVGLSIAIAVFIKVRRRNDMTKRCNDPEKLFRELCLIHKLDRESQKLLAQLAEAAGLRQPAEVFVRPSLYEGEHLPEQMRRDQQRLRQLSEKLF